MNLSNKSVELFFCTSPLGWVTGGESSNRPGLLRVNPISSSSSPEPPPTPRPCPATPPSHSESHAPLSPSCPQNYSSKTSFRAPRSRRVQHSERQRRSPSSRTTKLPFPKRKETARGFWGSQARACDGGREPSRHAQNPEPAPAPASPAPHATPPPGPAPAPYLVIRGASGGRGRRERPKGKRSRRRLHRGAALAAATSAGNPRGRRILPLEQWGSAREVPGPRCSWERCRC